MNFVGKFTKNEKKKKTPASRWCPSFSNYKVIYLRNERESRTDNVWIHVQQLTLALYHTRESWSLFMVK